MPSYYYMTDRKAAYRSCRQDAFTPDRESTSSRFCIVPLLGKIESLGKNCILSPEDGQNVDTPCKLVKKVLSQCNLTKEFTKCHMNSEKEMTKEKNDPAEQLCSKVRRIKQIQAIQKNESDIQFSWAERWRPERLSDFICNKPQARDLQILAKQRTCPHMIFEGPPGAGKTSLIRAMVGGIFEGEDVPVRRETLTIELKGVEIKILVPLIANRNYTEISLNGLGGYERNVIDRLVNARFKTNSYESIVDYKVVVIREADTLSTDTQCYIRLLMERHKESCKLIFCCSNASRLEPISPLCKIIHVKPPTIEQIIQVLQRIAKKEKITLPRAFAKRIAESSDKRLPQAIGSLEACKKSQYPFIDNQKILIGWEGVIAKIARSMVEEQTPKQLYNIRAMLQKLIIQNLSPNFVFSILVEELKKHLDDDMQSQLQNLYAVYNGNMDNGGDPLTENQTEDYALYAKRYVNHYIQIEEFTARFMSFYKARMSKINITKDQNQSDD